MSEQIIPSKLMPRFQEWMKTDPKPIEGLGYHETFMALESQNKNI